MERKAKGLVSGLAGNKQRPFSSFSAGHWWVMEAKLGIEPCLTPSKFWKRLITCHGNREDRLGAAIRYSLSFCSERAP
jgi:hypothetical protein